jgi:hypothetical protein
MCAGTVPDLVEMPPVPRDIRRCLRFVAQPWGGPEDREREISRGKLEICRGPELNEIGARRPSIGIELRRHNAAQFAIIYAYIRPKRPVSAWPSQRPRGSSLARQECVFRRQRALGGVRFSCALDAGR